MEVITKREGDENAALAFYNGGDMQNGEKCQTVAPTGIMEKSGTSLIVRDMFHNNAARRKAMSNAVTEWKLILEIVQKYQQSHGGRGYLNRAGCFGILRFSTNLSTHTKVTYLLNTSKIWPKMKTFTS